MRHRFLLALFAATLFVNALLLFSVQPMFSKMVLPLLGGAPAVWNTCMLFFQVALLTGYLYAHLTTSWLGVRRQAVMHIGLLAASLFTLPIAVGERWTPPAGPTPIPWLIALLTISLGAPFVMLSACAPMLQKWFAHTDHPAARTPYFLYAASNLGSMVALLGYLVLAEPQLRLAQQSWSWTAVYWLVVLLMGACALMLWRSSAGATTDGRQPSHAPQPTDARVVERSTLAAEAPETKPEALAASCRLRWVLLSFAPSSLLLGVTTYLSTDVAAVPLLWVVPLAIYLLTFVIVFSRRPVLPHRWMVTLQPPVILFLIITLFWSWRLPLTALVPLHLLAFFVTAMVCHGELARSRPSAARLTEFYVWISLGGALGGVFNVLIGPAVFDRVLEYPLAITLACLLRPSTAAGGGEPFGRWLDIGVPAALGLFASLPSLGFFGDRRALQIFGMVTASIVAVLLGLVFADRPLRFGLIVGAVLVAGGLGRFTRTDVLLAERSYFGVYEVRRPHGRAYHVLTHGTTVHGAQSLNPARRREPLTYYHRDGPLPRVFGALDPTPGRRRVAVIGLGTGTTACYGAPGERWTYYEIDPLVERIARHKRYFTYLSDCSPEVDVVLGDARLRLAEAKDRSYDLIVVDAFSSDAIPVHLITREAVALYFRKLAKRGILAVHISNRHLDLEPVLAAIARDAGVAGLIHRDLRQTKAEQAAYRMPSVWAVLARPEAHWKRITVDSLWRPLSSSDDVALWTDDFSNILTIIK